jgi:acyl-CoA synthetase (AMP-forming)/AMP-acid ligase II
VRWDEAHAARAYDRGLWVRHTMADTLRRAANDTPERIILIDGDRRIDCRSLCEEATALAEAMLAHTPTGSVVSFMLPNWHEAVVIYLATAMAGMVVNPILPSLRDRELAFILRDVDSKIVFVPSSLRQFDHSAMMTRVNAQLPMPPTVVVVRGEAGGHTSYEAFVQRRAKATTLPAHDPDAVRMVLYTSGTTGRPKGVLHTHNSLHAMICQLRDNWLFEPGDSFLVPSPVGHITGLFCAIECPLILGLTAVLMDQWNAEEAVRLTLAEGCTHFVGATPFLEQYLAAAQRARTRLPTLKIFACGGASVPPSLIYDAVHWFEHALVTRIYGSTEVPHITIGVITRYDIAHGAETDGCADITEIKFAAYPGAKDGEGEVYARGPQMLVGYLNADDETDAFDADGFFKTGDLARWVDRLFLVVTGRAKDVIIRNGENISPKEVEDLLVRHPDIAEIAIVGLPDPRTGERACAVIVPKTAPGPDVASLSKFLAAAGVAKFKIPEQVVLCDALPKNDAGKVLKHKIRAELAD